MQSNKISINIPFWYSKEDRLSNLKTSFKSVRSLQKYLINSGLDVEVNVFEFSEERQCFGGSIYLPVEKGYNKSIRSVRRRFSIPSTTSLMCFGRLFKPGRR